MKDSRLGSRGVTLVEILIALVISAIAITLTSQIFFAGHREFVARIFESDRLSGLMRLQGAMHHSLHEKISRCRDGKLWLSESSSGAEVDLEGRLKKRFPGLDSLVFRCFETDAASEQLVEWKDRFQPQLVEFRVLLKARKHTDLLEGSVLK